MRVVTIGGYGFNENDFVARLVDAGVTCFLDVRQRRGMRGSRYAFLNSKRLQKLLADVGIAYKYLPSLAPTPHIRALQAEDDVKKGVTKGARTALSTLFKNEYLEKVIGTTGPSDLDVPRDESSVVAVFCVERSPAACHRSLAAEHISRMFAESKAVEHLAP